jgi:hypothetical protein
MPLRIDIPDPRTALGTDREFQQVPGAISGGAISGGLAEVAEFYRQLGFDSGYARAAADQLEFSVTIAEQILREHSDSVRGPQDARRILYSFIARMDRRLNLFANLTSTKCDEGYMEGGLGI